MVLDLKTYLDYINFATMKELFKEIQEIDMIDKNNHTTVEKAVCKMAEEFGELVQAVNMTIGMKTTNLSPKKIKNNVAEETADLIQNAFCVAKKCGVSYEDIEKFLKKKNTKWRKKVEKRK